MAWQSSYTTISMSHLHLLHNLFPKGAHFGGAGNGHIVWRLVLTCYSVERTLVLLQQVGANVCPELHQEEPVLGTFLKQVLQSAILLGELVSYVPNIYRLTQTNKPITTGRMPDFLKWGCYWERLVFQREREREGVGRWHFLRTYLHVWVHEASGRADVNKLVCILSGNRNASKTGELGLIQPSLTASESVLDLATNATNSTIFRGWNNRITIKIMTVLYQPFTRPPSTHQIRRRNIGCHYLV